MQNDTDIEPLDPATWFERIELLMQTISKMDGNAPDPAIRKAYHLVMLAPGPIRELLPDEIDEDAFERLLDCGGYESAIMALIGPMTSFTIRSNAGEGSFSVQMSLEPQSIFGKGQQNSCAKAMLQAWAECFLNLGKAAESLSPAHLDPHRSPIEQPQKSTRH